MGGGGDKLSRAFIFASPFTWAQAMIAHVWSSGEVLVLDPARGIDDGGRLRTTAYNDGANLRWLGITPGRTALFASENAGRWYCIEAHVKLNDAGQANGVNTLWIDGQLEAQRTDLDWVGTFDSYGVNAVFIENYWNAGSPRAQERYIDNLVVSTTRIGCTS